MNEVEFAITKKIGETEFEIPVAPDDLMELLHEATYKGGIAWEVDGNGVRFFYNENKEIGSIHFWECKDKNDLQQKETNI